MKHRSTHLLRAPALRLLTVLALLASAALSACGGGDSTSPAADNSVGSLRLIGQQVLPRRSEFGGTVVGGLSGIDYDATNNRYVLVSDDRTTTDSANAPGTTRGIRMAETSLPTKARRRGLSEAWFAWLLIFPAMAFIGVIVAWPLLETIRLSFTDADLGVQIGLLGAAWEALDRAVEGAAGLALRMGPRGGGRDLVKMVAHVLGAEQAYVRSLGAATPRLPSDPFEARGPLRSAAIDALRARVRGDVPDFGERGGRRWQARYFVRRAAWHVLDHAWEIEDRSV